MRNDWGMDRYEGRRFEGGGSMMREGSREREMRETRGDGERMRGMRDDPERMRGMRDDPERMRGMRDREMMREDDRPSYGDAPIVKVIEVVAQSPHSWEDAARRAVAEASRTIRDIKSIWIADQTAIVADERIVEFRLVAKVSFAVRDSSRRRERGYA